MEEELEAAARRELQAAAWFSVMEIPSLAFDHEKILQMALSRLQGKILISNNSWFYFRVIGAKNGTKKRRI
jgi:hypothetical protein